VPLIKRVTIKTTQFTDQGKWAIVGFTLCGVPWLSAEVHSIKVVKTEGLWTTLLFNDKEVPLILVSNKCDFVPHNIHRTNCPFCGTVPRFEEEMIDTVYPTDQKRDTYVCWCGNHDCGATMYGDSPIDAIEHWLRRA
jgi:hypothetical protein